MSWSSDHCAPFLARQGNVLWPDVVCFAQRSMMFLVLAWVLAACQLGLPSQKDSPTELAEALTEYRVIPANRAYVNVPTALLVMERDLGAAVEQRITLPNLTPLSGENVILLRAQTRRAAGQNPLSLSQALAQFGGAPAPFASISDSALAARSDAFGDVTYSVLRPGGEMTCVLALRRTQTGGRALPRGASGLDMLMRNCVQGGLDQALAPLGPAAFGLGMPRSNLY
ncbi:MAG: hypothetical protein LAT78_09540 [Roseinatronobacter sp.]|nr:hypothetical protein [Roseinatronobacter sp.]